jgi:methylenetetrahydrofolate reductase (NADPH)
MSALAKSASSPKEKGVLAKLTAAASFEITAREPEKAVASLEGLEKSVPIYVAHIPGDPWARVVETAVMVKNAGWTPIPHVVSRNIKDEADLGEFLKTLRGEIGTEKILCLGGDVDNPPGKFTMSRQLIETGLFEKSGIKGIGLAAYPEPHPKAPVEVFEKELQQKHKLAKDAGLDVWVITQFAFDPVPIVARLKSLREQGVDSRVRVGVAGPAGLKSLIALSMRCGVGNSLKQLTNRPAAIGKLITKHPPDDVVAGVVAELAKTPELNVEGLHFFCFGGVPAAATWRKEAQAQAA